MKNNYSHRRKTVQECSYLRNTGMHRLKDPFITLQPLLGMTTAALTLSSFFSRHRPTVNTRILAAVTSAGPGNRSSPTGCDKSHLVTQYTESPTQPDLAAACRGARPPPSRTVTVITEAAAAASEPRSSCRRTSLSEWPPRQWQGLSLSALAGSDSRG